MIVGVCMCWWVELGLFLLLVAAAVDYGDYNLFVMGWDGMK